VRVFYCLNFLTTTAYSGFLGLIEKKYTNSFALFYTLAYIMPNTATHRCQPTTPHGCTSCLTLAYIAGFFLEPRIMNFDLGVIRSKAELSYFEWLLKQHEKMAGRKK
jgi:hypothetical protein